MKILMMAILAATPPGATEKALAEAKVSMAEALDKGKAEGKAVSARLVEEKGKLVYRLRYAKDAECVKLAVDARGGEIVEKVAEKRSYAKSLAGAKLGSAQAIEAALKKAPGKAYGWKLGLEKGKPVYEVLVLAGGKRRELEICAVTGAVLEDEEEDDDDDDEDDDEDDDGDEDD